MMRFDIHVHLGARRPVGEPSLPLRLFRRQLRLAADADCSRRLTQWARSSDIDRFVLLAIDPWCEPGGRPCDVYSADNDQVAELVKTSDRFLFGASIHPGRPDAEQELQRCIAAGACLVKWIPSAQGIRLEAPECIAFYEQLAFHGLPLLVHTGPEHTVGRRANGLNDPRLLVHPLRRGVTVIAAHCGARMFLHEPCRFKDFCRMASEYERLYGDLSAFGIPTRMPLLRRLQRRPSLLAKVVYGSDFPAFVMPRSLVFWIGIQGVRDVLRQRNPLQRPRLLMQKLGLPEEIFSRAAGLLRLGAGRKGGT